MSVIVCPACDLAHHPAAPPVRGRTRCVRCRNSLQRPVTARIEVAVAVAVCALAFWSLGNAYPLVEMYVNGSTRATTLVGAALGFYAQGYASLAILMFLTTVAAPILQIAALLYVLIPLYLGRSVRGQDLMFRVLSEVRPWTFIEVFMLGALVALVRLSAFARVVPGVALWSCALLMFSLSALTSLSSPEQYWLWVKRCRK